jgi:putative heme-binding domain-containing protein
VLISLAMATTTASAEKPPREPWTTSRIKGSPDPAKPFVAAPTFPLLTFREVTEIVFDPVAREWIILERAGKVLSLPHAGDAEEATPIADLKLLHPDLDNLYSIVLHPKFAENRQVFVTYTTGAKKDDGTKLSRFEYRPDKSLTNEKVVLTWLSGGHNGASMQFGADGYLYVSTGDAEVPSPPDPRNTGQDVTDLLSSILRIDVDKQEAGLGYAIPSDNPFVQTPNVRPEIWAYGFRNPWKMSFDRVTGRLWCGDVGWELWEMIHLVEKGGNYGWSAMEASQPIRADAPKAPTPILPPVAAHSHDEAASITGGYVYYGSKFHELKGAYIYGDWETGKIWALWHDGKQVTRREEIADTPHKIICFGQDADGEIIYAHYGPQGTLHTLERNPEAGKPNAFPRKLSETGAVQTVPMFGKLPHEVLGMTPFTIQAQMWHGENSTAHYLLGLPGMGTVTGKIEKRKEKGRVIESLKMQWPKDAVLVKTITTHLKPSVHWLPVETQILHFDGEAWQGYSYRWDEDGKDATLVPAEGATHEYVDGAGVRRTWRYHSRAECMRCHNSWMNGALAFRPEQLAGVKSSWAGSTSQMQDLRDRAYVDDVVANFVPEVQLSRGNKDDRERDAAARTYLHVNCSHCHSKNAGGAVTMMLNAELAPEEMMAVGMTPLQGGLGLANPKLIDPGNSWNSVICVRMAKTGTGHMPIIGNGQVDELGLQQIESWIHHLGGKSGNPPSTNFDSETAIARKLGTVEGAMQVLHAVHSHGLRWEWRQTALDLAWKSPHQTVRDLFDRFKPHDQREETIGPNPDPAKLLAMKGDAKRGASVLSLQGKLALCYACHLVNGTGRDFGPDLSRVGSRLTREQILESLLQPNKVINQSYAAISAEMKDGTVHAGFAVHQGAHDITIKTATGQSVTLLKTNIKARAKLPGSLMPEGQLQSLTAQEVADVIAYLEGLR